MKTILLSLMSFGICISAAAQEIAARDFTALEPTDRTLIFDITAPGEEMPVVWGLDTAWPSEENIRRGVAYMGSDIIQVARVSFQPWDYLGESTELTARLAANLDERLRLVSLIGGPDKVKLILNNDAPDDVYDHRYDNPSTNEAACRAYCNLIHATLKYCTDRGWTVITVSPYNEPDYPYNTQGDKADFLALVKMLREDYPEFSNGSVRISGGNTLNCDEAMPWYTYLGDYIDEGNTHQLAGDFNHYADFFTQVRADGKYATADELHNVMECMVGVEYGMQTGIWWGTAELARGEFCKASVDGRRLAYSENRDAWTSAAVYRRSNGDVQGFIGSSERQAATSSFRFVSTACDMFFDGHGPTREYRVEIPGGTGYQNGQTNAECMVEITRGEDIRPVIGGEYQLMNAASGRVLTVDGEIGNFSHLSEKDGAWRSNQVWEVAPVRSTIGGDFSYYTIVLAESPNFKLDVNNWNLDEDGGIILYDGGLGNNEQWRLRYEGNGYFSISSRHSNLCLEPGSDGHLVQRLHSGAPGQLWRLLPSGAACETEKPDAPSALTAEPGATAVTLQWGASRAADVAGYDVARAVAGTDDFSLIARSVKGCSYIDNTAVCGVEYDYRVRAVDHSLNSSNPSATVTASATGAPTLLAHYKFDRDLYDATGNGFNAAFHTGSMYIKGNEGEALRTNNDYHVQLPYPLGNLNQLTIAAYLRAGNNADGARLLDFGNGEEQHMYLSLNEGGNMIFAIRNGETTQRVAAPALGQSSKWVHVAVTLGEDGAALYVDGVKRGESAAGEFTMRPSDFAPVLNYVAHAQSSGVKNFVGAIDDLRIYNYPLTDKEIAVLSGTDGIEGVALDADADMPALYYNMQGIRVETPSDGLFIKVEGRKAEKVYVK